MRVCEKCKREYELGTENICYKCYFLSTQRHLCRRCKKIISDNYVYCAYCNTVVNDKYGFNKKEND